MWPLRLFAHRRSPPSLPHPRVEQEWGPTGADDPELFGNSEDQTMLFSPVHTLHSALAPAEAASLRKYPVRW